MICSKNATDTKIDEVICSKNAADIDICWECAVEIASEFLLRICRKKAVDFESRFADLNICRELQWNTADLE